MVKKIAVVGVSTKPGKFGGFAYRQLKAKGYRVFPVNRNMETFDGAPCYASLKQVPEKLDGVVIVVPPNETERVVQEAEAAGIKRVWLQQGSESERVIQFCHEHEMKEVHGRCILMFAEPVRSYHRFHRGMMWLCGKLPQ